MGRESPSRPASGGTRRAQGHGTWPGVCTSSLGRAAQPRKRDTKEPLEAAPPPPGPSAHSSPFVPTRGRWLLQVQRQVGCPTPRNLALCSRNGSKDAFIPSSLCLRHNQRAGRGRRERFSQQLYLEAVHVA